MTVTDLAVLGGPALPQQRRLVTSVPGPRSRELAERKASAVAAGVGTAMPVFAAAAGGGVVVDVDGNSFIDLGSGIAVTGAGNAAPAVVDAVTDQVQRFTHTCFMVTPYESYLAVAEALNRLTPGEHEKRSVLFNSGAEAVENAVKIARAHTRKQAVVAFDHAYHGRTNLTLALTAKSMPYKHGFGPFASEVYRAPVSYPFRDGGLGGREAAARTISMIEKQVGADNLAAIIIEPILGEGGFIVPAEGFLPALVAWARSNGVVFIADEVQTGFARTGRMFASEHEAIVPDLITTAKGIAGGLGGTYGGNPLACAAALAAMTSFENDELLAAAERIGDVITRRFTGLAASDPRIGDVRGRGAMIAVEFVDPETGAPDTALCADVASRAHREGVIVLTCGTYGNVIRFLPPLTIPTELLEEGITIVADALAATATEANGGEQ